MIQGQVGANPQEPGPERSVSPPGLRVRPKTDKSLLHEIFGQVRITHNAAEMVQEIGPVAMVEPVERGTVPVRDTAHQITV